MSLSIGVSHLASPNPSAGTTTIQSACSSFGPQRWKLDIVRRMSLRVRLNPQGRSSGQVHEAENGEENFGRQGLSADYGANGGEFWEKGFDRNEQVVYRDRAAGRRSATLQREGRFWRRFPGFPQVGNRDVTVPSKSLRKGAVFRGIVSSVETFGAFVSFGAFTDGLVHISRLGTGFVKNVGDLVESGQEVMVRIVKVEESTGRISLSLMEKDEVDLRKPYVAPGREEVRHRGGGPRLHSRSGQSAPTGDEREERVSQGSYASTSRSMDAREGGGWPRYQPGSDLISQYMAQDEQDRYSSTRQREARREGGEKSRFQAGSARRSPFVVEEEEHITWNPFASTSPGKAGGGRIGSKNSYASPKTGPSREDRRSRNPFASPRQGENREGEGVSLRTRKFIGEDRQSRNPFASSRQWEAGLGDRASKSPFASPRKGLSRGEDRQSRNPIPSSRQWEAREERTSRNPSMPSRRSEAGEEGINTRFKYQGSNGNFTSRGRFPRVGNEVDREEKAKPRMKLVQMQSDVKSDVDQVSSGMRNVMSSWYECDCCY